MKRDLEIEGIRYTLIPYNFGIEVEINDRSIKVNFDADAKTVTPIPRAGMMRFLSVVHSLRSWTFRGCAEDGELITDEDIKILEINEENVKMLPVNHGSKLAKIAGEMNGIGEPEGKNSEPPPVKS